VTVPPPFWVVIVTVYVPSLFFVALTVTPVGNTPFAAIVFSTLCWICVASVFGSTLDIVGVTMIGVVTVVGVQLGAVGHAHDGEPLVLVHVQPPPPCCCTPHGTTRFDEPTHGTVGSTCTGVAGTQTLLMQTRFAINPVADWQSEFCLQKEGGGGGGGGFTSDGWQTQLMSNVPEALPNEFVVES